MSPPGEGGHSRLSPADACEKLAAIRELHEAIVGHSDHSDAEWRDFWNEAGSDFVIALSEVGVFRDPALATGELVARGTRLLLEPPPGAPEVIRKIGRQVNKGRPADHLLAKLPPIVWGALLPAVMASSAHRKVLDARNVRASERPTSAKELLDLAETLYADSLWPIAVMNALRDAPVMDIAAMDPPHNANRLLKLCELVPRVREADDSLTWGSLRSEWLEHLNLLIASIRAAAIERQRIAAPMGKGDLGLIHLAVLYLKRLDPALTQAVAAQQVGMPERTLFTAKRKASKSFLSMWKRIEIGE